MMRIPLLFSVSFHLAVFLLALFGLPSTSDDVARDYRVIDVEVVSETQTPEPQPIPKPKPPEPKKAKIPPPPPPPAKPEPPPPAALPEPPKQTAALPPEPTPEPEPEPMPEPKPAEAPPKPKPVEPSPKPKAEKKPAPPSVAPRPKSRPKPDFNTMMLKTVQKLKEKAPEEKAEEKEKKKSFEDKMAALMKKESLSPQEQAQKAPLGEDLTISEIDAIRRQIERCWLVPTTIGAKDVDKMKVEIGMKLNPDGSLRSARIVDQFRFETNPAYRAVAETALRAVRNPQCNKFDLPLEKYEIWKDMIVMFDPSDMVGQ